MDQTQLFSYSWAIDEEETEQLIIRLYGLNEKNENVCLIINGFTPYVYIELPKLVNKKWDMYNVQLLANKLDGILGVKRPVKKSLVERYKLYGANLDENGKKKKFPFLFCTFSHYSDIKNLSFKLRSEICVPQIGKIKLKIHESDANPILQLICCRDIDTAGWISFSGNKVTNNKVTLCDHEYNVYWKNIFPVRDKNIIPLPKIMSFDLEVNSSNPTMMPQVKKPGDKIFQISCIISRPGWEEKEYKKYLISLGNPSQKIVGENITIITCDSEPELMEKFSELIRLENPNLIAGFNILGFDINYMIGRDEMHGPVDFRLMGFHKFHVAKEKTIKWSSSAYKDQEFQFLDAEGRIFIDLLPLVRRDYKFNNYKLKTISEYFLGDTKDDLSHQGIFQCYREGVKKRRDGTFSEMAKKYMGICGKYCIKDSVLVTKLLDKLQTWIGLVELAKICKVPIFTLYTQGQQIKVYSQIYYFCLKNGIVVEKDGYLTKENDRYMGAYVFEPIPGKYQNVVSFDFSSLYPSTIIAYNIDYSTIVDDEDTIENSKCHVFDWEEHIGCSHDPKVIERLQLSDYINREEKKIKEVRNIKNKLKGKEKEEKIKIIEEMMLALKPSKTRRSELMKSKPKVVTCCTRSFRFLKEPRGVLPTVIQNLLDARKNTRGEMKHLNKNTEMMMLNILNARQLALKVSANSMYGAMGVRKGYLPFMPGAMCTTFMGRTNIQIVANVIQEDYGGMLIYGDTDSNYVSFPKLHTTQEIWDYSVKIAKEVSQLFPNPIELAFEDAIYSFYFILTKKRYMYKSCDRDGNISNKIGSKGVLLSRRDNCEFVREIYETVVKMISDDMSEDTVISYLLDQINLLCSYSIDISKFVVTKSVGSIEGKTKIIDDKGKEKMMIGNYKVPYLADDIETRNSQMRKKNVKNEQEFYLSCLPAQVQLAERMRNRGMRVEAGSRLEYVITTNGGHDAHQYEKVESYEYFKKYREILRIDTLYYLHSLKNPIDQLLKAAFKREDFILKQYKYRSIVRQKNINKINMFSKPTIEIAM